MLDLQHSPIANPERLDAIFPRLPGREDDAPAWCLTADAPRCTQRFFDTTPISPSGRYLAVTQLPTEQRPPESGDTASVLLFDLMTGQHERVAETRGWDAQLGAQVQWGATDHDLLFNEVDLERDGPVVFGVRLDPFTGDRLELDQTIYMAEPSGRRSATVCLKRIGRTQRGYGVLLPEDRVPQNPTPPEDDGVWVTDLTTGRSERVVSLAEIARQLELEPVPTYSFHVKWNPQGDRLMLVVRQWLEGRPRPMLVTLRPDGSELKLAVPAEVWARGGHHPQWAPDGEHVLMNLRLGDAPLDFASVLYDGSDLRQVAAPALGSGHPSFNPAMDHILSDAYLREPMAGPEDSPLRWVRVADGVERELLRVPTRPACADLDHPLIRSQDGGLMRIDPHPVFDRTGQLITFNGRWNGERAVFLTATP
ncbi:MAG: hypothetical protein AAGI68_04750 [Planctomycetota bacterium]